MKVAFHFNADDDSLGGYYGFPIKVFFFRTILKHRTLNISTKIFIGDLLLHNLAMDVTRDGDTETHTFNPQKYDIAFERWINPGGHVWRQFNWESLESAYRSNIYVLCLESVDSQTANYLHEELIGFSPYLGAMEVDDSSVVHWHLYSNSLIPAFRVINRELYLFWDGYNEDTKQTGLQDDFEKIGFAKVCFESLEGKYSIFDQYHNYEHARRIAEWKTRCGNLLAFMADDVVSRLTDVAPDLGDRLWSMLKTFEEAETNEQYAQVTASCRRIIEYISDVLFPPVEGTDSERKLERKHYRNRLLAFADIERKSDANIDLIVASTEMLSSQIEKLSELSNKGVHTEVYRHEARRCLLRTLMLLDDIISLKRNAFPIKPKLDFEEILSLVRAR